MDRRFVWAIVLMMLIAVLPSFFVKPTSRRPVPTRDTTAVAPPGAQVEAARPSVAAADSLRLAAPAASSAPAETVTVRSPLYRYSFASRGGGMIGAQVSQYHSLNPASKGQPVELVPAGETLNQLGFVAGRDTLWLKDWDLAPSARSVEVAGVTPLVFKGSRGGVAVEIRYEFAPDDYLFRVRGHVDGLGPTGGQLVVGMGSGMDQTEADSLGNYLEFALVTKSQKSELHRFRSLTRDTTTTVNGPFEWAAVKSKYFAAALLLTDDSLRISGVTVHPLSPDKRRTRADVRLGLPVPAQGDFGYRLYVGPMEQDRLGRIGHDFDDINPYGWAIVRPIIRPVAMLGRWLLVWMHQNLHLAYGICLIIFGVMIRVVLWPLNQKGMRASLRMQALQPEMQVLQEKYKEDPQQMQRQLMELYKKHGVNPFSGCWPVLLPWPILIALFVVFQYSIELRGQSFLWLPDLSQKDPLYILPIVMGISMFGVNWVGMRGLPPNPQTKMMLYFLPIMMTVLFVTFASGLNLYYTVQNLVSIPQQWLLSKERLKHKAAMTAPAPTKKK
jgi:YidC/Oxa1 family membrane protein insertase